MLYQADHRARLEQLERSKRDGEHLFEQAKSQGPRCCRDLFVRPEVPLAALFQDVDPRYRVLDGAVQ